METSLYAIPNSKKQFAYSEELVCYNQQPFRIEGDELKDVLHRSVVAMNFLNVYKRSNAGSGVLISNNIILTAAHNIFNKELQAENTNFKVFIGANGTAEEYYQVEAWRFPEEFKTCPPSAKLPHDYAIMKLKQPIYLEEYMSLQLACEDCLLRDNKTRRLNVFGFPYSYPPDALGNVRTFQDNFKPLDKNGKRIKLYQYGLAREERIAVVDASQFKLGYGISTLPGMSGCPLVVDDNIIAVHVGGDKAQFNVGRIIDVDFIQNLWKWIEELNGAIFRLEDKFVCSHVSEKLCQLKYKLDLSDDKFTNINQLEYINLRELDLHRNKLLQIDLKNYLHLTKLKLQYNQLNQIDISNNKHLTHLQLQYNKLQLINTYKNKSLSHLQLQFNKLQYINVNANYNLIFLDLGGNNFQQIDVSTNIYLTHLYLYKNNLRDMDISTNTRLSDLRLADNKLSKIDLSQNIHLTTITLDSNNIEQIDLRANTLLNYLDLYSNKISHIDVSANIHLRYLHMHDNKLKEIDVSANINLIQLFLNGNELQSIDVKANINLVHLYLHQNQLQKIEGLTEKGPCYVTLSNNKLSQIDFTNTEMQRLDIQDNRLTLIRLGIFENVNEKQYVDQYSFDLSNQQSSSCRVQLICKEQSQMAKEKTSKIAEKWREKYSNRKYNKHNCMYTFSVL